MALRYHYPDSVLLDVIPYYHEGKYHIFYLRGNTSSSGWARGQSPWAHMISKDLIHWDELPLAIETGTRSEPDGYGCYTGSVIVKDSIWHIFYVGFNPGHPGGREQIMHAISFDGVHFEKDIANPVVLIDKRYYGACEDWRDPFVFWNDDEKLYWMSVTSGSSNPISGITRGVIGLAKSSDLVNWEVYPPIYSPNSYPSMECSDIFKMNDYWYMIFSQYGYTEYRMAKSLYGPWTAPANPVLDGGYNFFYAAKTLFDGERRLLFGWCGTLESGDSITGEWGGDMVSPREIVTGTDGLLELKCPCEMKKGYIECNYDVIPKIGSWNIKGSNTFENRSCEGFSAVHLHSRFNEGLISARIKPGTGKGKCGFLLNSSDDLSDCYLVSIDIGLNVLEIYRRKSYNTFAGVHQDGIRLLLVQYLSLETPEKEIFIELFYENGIAEVFINSKSVSTIRLKDLKGGCAGFFTTDNLSEFRDVQLFKNRG